MKSSVCLFSLSVKRRSTPSFLEQRSVGSPTVSENIENLIISVKMIKREMDLRVLQCCGCSGGWASSWSINDTLITPFSKPFNNNVNILVDAVIDSDGLISTLANARCQMWGTCVRHVTHQSTWESQQTQKCSCGQTVNASWMKDLPRCTKIHMFIHQVLPRDLCSPALVHGCWDTGEPHQYIHESWKVDGKHFSSGES